MNCERCGAELSIDRGLATKGWCSDRCYELDHAEDERDPEQLGLDETEP